MVIRTTSLVQQNLVLVSHYADSFWRVATKPSSFEELNQEAEESFMALPLGCQVLRSDPSREGMVTWYHMILTDPVYSKENPKRRFVDRNGGPIGTLEASLSNPK